MLKKILKIISLKNYFNKKEKHVWLKVPTTCTCQAEKDHIISATINKLEQILNN